MSTYWTLDCDGDERTLDGWGIAEEGFGASFGNMVVDTLNVPIRGALVTDDELWAYEAPVRVMRGRRDLGGGVFDLGTIEFQGKRLLHVVEGRPGFEGVVYQFGGPWYDLDVTPYQQEFMKYAGSPPALVQAWSGDLVLFQKLNSSYAAVAISTGEQITRILQHCLDAYTDLGLDAPFQIGTIGVEVWLNTYQARDMKCSEAIRHCLRPSPDATVQMDYTVVPPLINVVKRSSMTGVSVALANLVNHETIRLTPRYDLQPLSVKLDFKQTNTYDESSGLQVTTQVYPVGGATAGPGVITQTIELDGWHITTVKGKLDCVAVSNNRTFWSGHFPDLRSTRCRRFRVGPLTYTDEDTGKSVTLADLSVVDKDGATVSLSTYPNMILDGTSVASWMKLPSGAQVVAVKAKITAEISCKEYDVEASGNPETSTNGRMLSKYLRKQVEAQVTLTNATSGYYATMDSFSGAEAIPTGLAQSIYEALATLQYQGSFSLVEVEPSGAVTMGKVVNLTGLRSEWATMGALVQQIQKDYGNPGGVRTTVTIGPAAHLDAGDLTQLFLMHRCRRVWKNPATQATGKTSNEASSMELGDKTPGQNSLPGLAEPSKRTVSAASDTSGNKVMIHHDAEGGQVQMNEKNASGTVDTAKPQVTIKMSDLQYAD